MGLFKSIAKVAGAAIGGAVGGPIGAKIGGSLGAAAGGAAEGGKKKKKRSSSSSSSNSEVSKPDIAGLIQESPDISAILSAQGETKVAESFLESNPAFSMIPQEKREAWLNTYEWYEDLGGDMDNIRPEVLI